MKKSITVLALSVASTSAMALVVPPAGSATYKTICLEVFEPVSGAAIARSCDATANNARSGVPLLVHGCAEGQIALNSRIVNGKADPQFSSCMPPNLAQL